MSAVPEGLNRVEMGPGVELWTPATDLLHGPNIVPQEPGSETVLLGLPFGECGGVRMANQVIEALYEQRGGQLYGNHAPTHGADSTAAFEAMGATFGVEPGRVALGMPYVVSAHGAAPSVFRAAEAQELELFDVTCPLVVRTHRAIARAAQRGDRHVAYISFGSAEHAERVGAAGVAEDAGIVFSAISNHEDVDALVKAADPEKIIVVVGQTTNNSDAADALAVYLRDQAKERAITVEREGMHDVCHTVRDRQHSTRKIVGRGVGALVVVGSVNSKNTLSLAKVAAREAEARGNKLSIYLTNSWGQVPQLDGTVGVVSGASTRGQNVQGIVRRLNPAKSLELVGEDTDKDIVFSPVHEPTRRLLDAGQP